MVPMWYHSGMAINLRLTPEEQELLDALAADSGLSKNDVLRRALVEKAAREGHRAKVDASFEWAVNRYGDLLRRLGEA